jgi:acyl-coenzyme A synthetase/AMP-(fatty) acid ligase
MQEVRVGIVSPLFSHAPDTVAAVVGNRTILYGELCSDIHRAATFLSDQGLGANSPIGIYLGPFQGPDDYRAWIAHLAALRIGARHATIHNASTVRALFSAEKVDALIGQLPRGAAIPTGLRTIPFDLQSMPTAESSADNERGATRLCSTSGTTGTPKIIPWDSAIIEARVEQVTELGLINSTTRLDCFLPFATTGGFRYPLATWRAGGTVLLSESIPSADGRRQAVHSTLSVCSPFQLRHFMSQSRRWPNRGSRTIVSLGGRIPRRVRDWALANLADKILIGYGSTETGNIAVGDAMLIDRHPGAVGLIRPGVEVQIVDKDGGVVEPGKAGRIQLRTPVMGGGKRGWFEPGDHGVLFEDGVLAIEGRSTDVFNIGGLKMSAQTYEARLMALSDIDDVGMVIDMQPTGDVLAVAVVARDGLTPSQLLPAVSPLLPANIQFRLVLVRSIPRNAMGKIDRSRLAEQLRRRSVAVRAEQEHA